MTQKTQKSLLWIISAVYLTMVFSGGVLATMFVYIGAIILVFIGVPHIVSLFVIFLLQLAGYLLGLKIGINFARGRAFLEQKDYFKISAIVATIPIVFLLIFSRSKGFELIDLAVILDSLIIFYSAKYFLGKESEDTKNTQSFSKIWVVAAVGILVIAGIFCWQYFAAPKEVGTHEGMPEIAKEATRSIIVTSPNGGEKLNIGQTYAITWDSTITDNNVSIFLLESQDAFHKSGAVIIEDINASPGEYLWTIPSIINANEYKIVIEETGFYLGGDMAYDMSDDYFSIVLETACAALQNQSLCLDNTNCYWDQQYNNCRIYNSTKQICSSPDANNGKNIHTQSHTYGFFQEYANERDKRIRVGKIDICIGDKLRKYYCADDYYIETFDFECPIGHICVNGACKDDKMAHSITVTSPNGGEKWIEGEKRIIEWKQNGLEEESGYICLMGFDKNNSPISVEKNLGSAACSYSSSSEGMFTYLIAEKFSLKQGKYDWTIPFNLSNKFENTPVSYKIGIPVLEASGKFSGTSEWAGCVAKDESNHYFNIILAK